MEHLKGGIRMTQMNERLSEIVGPKGTVAVQGDDELVRKLMMIVEGECEGLGPTASARKYGYTRQRYDQLRKAFLAHGAKALVNLRRGPKTNYRRTEEVVRLIIRHRFLDPDASPEIIAQKMRQCGWTISARSIERVVTLYGLQKKTRVVPPKQ